MSKISRFKPLVPENSEEIEQCLLDEGWQKIEIGEGFYSKIPPKINLMRYYTEIRVQGFPNHVFVKGGLDNPSINQMLYSVVRFENLNYGRFGKPKWYLYVY